ncbi:MAG: zinc ribbon domain-containing protein [Candidatus Omnitrophica bacterium]|nr:zinc ribbon domain-containing protein [Candidatus Omnitrophota bacterium]
MPTYEYFCQNCENRFEIKVSVSEKEKGLKVKCPRCGSNKTFQILGNFFTFSKGGSGSGFGGGCGPNPMPGCCG